MRILHLSSEYPPAKIYGLGRFVHGLARAQAAQGDEVFVLTNSTGGAEDGVVIDGVRLHRISFPNPPRPADAHGEVFQFNHGLVARFLDRRDVFGAIDVVASHDWLTALAAREIARLVRAPLVVTFHDEVVGKYFGNLPADARFVRDLEALTAHDATRVIANSRFIADQVCRHYGVASRRVEAIHGGIDPRLLEVARPDRVADFRSVLAEDGEILVAYVGRFDQEKGLGTLAEAALLAGEACSELRFVFAGSGREEALLREKLARLGQRARVLGYLGGETLSYLYRATDVTVVPSLYEPLGLVALEGMLAEAAVVVSGAGGLPEIVEHAESGLVVPPGDARALADALVRLVDDPGERERLGAAGAARARREFSWSRSAVATREAYTAAIMDGKALLASRRPVEPARPLVTVTLVTHEASIHVETALRSLFARTNYPSLEAVVVDNGSSVPVLARIRTVAAELVARGHTVRLLENPENRLFSAAQNQAIREARGEYVCLLNDDTEVPAGSEGWLRGLVWALETYEAGTVTPVTLQRDGRIYCAGAFSTGGHHLKDELDRAGLVTAPRRTEWNNAACLLTRRRFFEQIGPLREDGEFAHYNSDLEWCRRLTDKLGLAHWVHPVRLRHYEKEARRDANAPFQATAETRIPASVVIVAYGQLAYTREAVDAVLAHTAPPFELVLVDNGSRDGTREFFHSLEGQHGGAVAAQVIENDENLGYPKAANQGIRSARGRHLVLLNNDTQVRAGWLAALLEAAASRDRVGIVTAKILCPDGRVQNAGGIFHHPDGSFTLPFAHEDRLAPTVTERREVESAGGPCMLLTRDLLDRVGVFDEAFSPAYFEDSDLCLRAREAGFKLVYEPKAEVVHVGKVTAEVVAREGKQELWRRFEENKRLFYGRWSRRLAEDEAARRKTAEAAEPRRRILLCANRPLSGPVTPGDYCERELRRRNDVVTAGRGRDVDLGPEATAREIVHAAGGDFDLLLVIEGDTYVPSGLDEAPCTTALWAIDNHIHASRPDGWHLRAAPAFDHVFCAQRDYLPAFAKVGVGAHWIPNACEPSLFDGPAPARDADIVFVGHVLQIHERRRALLERLGRRFRLVRREGVYGTDMAALLRRAKIVWNCSLAGDLNMRVFEGLASGSLVVTDRIANGLGALFGDGEHLALYDDNSLESVVERFLGDNRAREETAARGQRLATRHHTYEVRMRELLRVASSTPLRQRNFVEVAS